jgi:hypothetical protein
MILFFFLASCVILLFSREAQTTSTRPSSDLAQECKLFNGEFRNEYLYAATNLGLRRDIFTWLPEKLNHTALSQFKPTFNDDDKQGLWTFERLLRETNITGNASVFLIKNVKFNEYLYASSARTLLFDSFRFVYTWRFKTQLDESFQWHLERKYDNRFVIRNVKYGEILFAPSDGGYRRLKRRKIFTAQKPVENCHQWIFMCRDQNKLPE